MTHRKTRSTINEPGGFEGLIRGPYSIGDDCCPIYVRTCHEISPIIFGCVKACTPECHYAIGSDPMSDA